MPFVPHTTEDITAMLASIGADSIEQLFDEIPAALKSSQLDKVPVGLSEMAITRVMQERAEADGRFLSFIGAGAYETIFPRPFGKLPRAANFIRPIRRTKRKLAKARCSCSTNFKP